MFKRENDGTKRPDLMVPIEHKYIHTRKCVKSLYTHIIRKVMVVVPSYLSACSANLAWNTHLDRSVSSLMVSKADCSEE